MGWAKIGTLCSLKAIAVACFLTPAATVLPTTPALAQFNIIIPGFGGGGYHGRRYGRRHGRSSRSARRGRRGGEQPGEVSAAPTGSTDGAAVPSGTGTSTGKKFRGTSD